MNIKWRYENQLMKVQEKIKQRKRLAFVLPKRAGK